MIGSSNFSRNFFHSGSRGSGVSRLAPKRCRLSATASARQAARLAPGNVAGNVLRSVRMVSPDETTQDTEVDSS